ncbi:MAG: FGGY-family carbohydrate kinase [[Clostridium] innocuum]
MTQAVFEGVSYAIREALENMKLAQWPSRIQINGGGTRSPVWMQIMAEYSPYRAGGRHRKVQHPGYGAALLAALADGVSEAGGPVSDRGRYIQQDKAVTDAYDRQYKKYKRMYCALKNIMQE